jgi:hypothetical protein
LRSASLRVSLRREEVLLLSFTRHLFLSARTRLGNVPGYYRSSLAGLRCGALTRVLLTKSSDQVKASARSFQPTSHAEGSACSLTAVRMTCLLQIFVPLLKSKGEARALIRCLVNQEFRSNQKRARGPSSLPRTLKKARARLSAVRMTCLLQIFVPLLKSKGEARALIRVLLTKSRSNQKERKVLPSGAHAEESACSLIGRQDDE